MKAKYIPLKKSSNSAVLAIANSLPIFVVCQHLNFTTLLFNKLIRLTYICYCPIGLRCLRCVERFSVRFFLCVMDLYGSTWGGQSVNPNSGQLYAPPDVPPHNHPHQYYSPASYQYPAPPQSAQFNPAAGPVFVNQFAQNVAMQYGSEAIGQGRQLVQEKVRYCIVLLPATGF